MNEQHEMILEKTYSSGADEWYCPTCGRRVLLRALPSIEMLVVEPGDEHANHSGSVRGGHIRLVQREEEFDEPSEEVTEESLRPWIQAIEKLDLDW